MELRPCSPTTVISRSGMLCVFLARPFTSECDIRLFGKARGRGSGYPCHGPGSTTARQSKVKARNRQCKRMPTLVSTILLYGKLNKASHNISGKQSKCITRIIDWNISKTLFSRYPTISSESLQVGRYTPPDTASTILRMEVDLQHTGQSKSPPSVL